MNFQIDQGLEILQRTPGVLRALLGDLGPYWTQANYGENTFSPFDVLGHLIHGERTDWIPRAIIILEHGESSPFVPFDRFAQNEASAGKTVADLLDEFVRLRAANISTLREMALTDGQLALRGTHPDFGSVTLGEMLATWVVHDLNHIAQIMRAMAYQYRSDVGPWAKYLSILRQ